MVFDADLMFVIGFVVLLFAIPPIFGAISEGRPPRAAAILILIGGGLLVIAVMQKPGGYSFETIPDVFVRVVGRFVG